MPLAEIEAPSEDAFILPRVRKILVCGDAAFDLEDDKWLLKSPWSVVKLPSEMAFPFRQNELWIYAQLVRGIGACQLHVQLRQKFDKDGERDFRPISVSEAFEIAQFDSSEPLLAEGVVFQLAGVPFREEGIYEFRIVARVGDVFQALEGEVAEVTMLDRRSTL